MALPTANLALDLDARVGVSASGGRVSRWDDRHLSLNSDGSGPHHAVQGDTTYQPMLTRDWLGAPCLLFPWGYGAAHPKYFLEVPASLTITTQACTVYAVAAQSNYEYQALFTFKGWGNFFPWIGFYNGVSGSSYAPIMKCATAYPALYTPINKSIYGAANGTSELRVCLNGQQWAGAKLGATILSGADIGIDTFGGTNEYPFSGLIYRILVYKAAHSAATMQAVVEALAAEHAVQQTYHKQIVFRGDSLTAGQAADPLGNYSFQVLARRPEWRIFNLGVGGQMLSTMITRDSTGVDPLYDASLDENVIGILAGTNDIGGDGIDGATCFTRLQTWCQARKAAHAGWNIRVITVPARGSATMNGYISDYNALIRAGDPAIDRLVDVGRGSLIEPALSDENNPTYFQADKLHLTTAGYGVIAKHLVGEMFERRAMSGFFG